MVERKHIEDGDMNMKYRDFSELDHYFHAVDYVLKKRKKGLSNYDRLLKYRGGKCGICGSKRDLEFHHTVTAKETDVYRCKTLKDMKEEAKKCILVCMRCHEDIHDTEPGENEDMDD